MKKNKQKTSTQVISYSMTHYCTAIFGSQKPLATVDWTCNLVMESKLHVGHKCAVVEHTSETIFIYASKTLDAELD